jgi:hypothetical protein
MVLETDSVRNSVLKPEEARENQKLMRSSVAGAKFEDVVDGESKKSKM